MATGEAILAICMTEPNAGTDVPNYTTNTDIKGDRVIVNGVKTLICRADIAEMFVVFTRVDRCPGAKGIGCVLVPGGAKGMTVEVELPYHGRRIPERSGSSTTSSCRWRTWYSQEDGMKKLLSAFNTQRCLNPAICLGLAEGALEEAVTISAGPLRLRQEDRGFPGPALESR